MEYYKHRHIQKNKTMTEIIMFLMGHVPASTCTHRCSKRTQRNMHTSFYKHTMPPTCAKILYRGSRMNSTKDRCEELGDGFLLNLRLEKRNKNGHTLQYSCSTNFLTFVSHIHPDIVITADWTFKINYLSIYLTDVFHLHIVKRMLP